MHHFFLAVVFLSWNLVVEGVISNISYGSDPQQIYDLYVPLGKSECEAKVLIMIHGGAWKEGHKEDMNGVVAYMHQELPGYYIANMEYRLGSPSSPGFPKQLHDIYFVIQNIKLLLDQKVTFALQGASAGAHLSMLYEYAYDNLLGDDVKAIVNYIGPADLTDTNYRESDLYNSLFINLVGNCSYEECPDSYWAASPVKYVNEKSAPTIGFYGNADPLIPNSQMPILRNALEDAGVYNNFTVYNGGHGGWAWEDMLDLIKQSGKFLRNKW